MLVTRPDRGAKTNPTQPARMDTSVDMDELDSPGVTPSKYPLLDRVRSPRDLRNLSIEQLRQVADELRGETL
ncbi:hypothetical protein HPQ61_20900, partial [Acetobacteraceae bacterium]|nr:hypothetical protein [Acetobacteraceae bacterium]